MRLPTKKNDFIGCCSIYCAPVRYVGLPNAANISYVDTKTKAAETMTVGGYLEPHAAGTTGPASHQSVQGVSGDVIKVATPAEPWSVSSAIAGSSLFYAAAVATVLPGEATKVDMKFPYWTPANQAQAGSTLLLADGGCMENLALITMIQRKVSSIVAVISCEAPLYPRGDWDPHKEPYKGKEVDDSFTEFFGVQPKDPKTFGYDYSHNQVFSTDAFVPTVAALQDAQANGTGAIITVSHTTVANKRWAIEAGFQVNVTWVYLTRMSKWEDSLTSDFKHHVMPGIDPSNPKNVPKTGPFRNFPHYDDAGQIVLTTAQANLLADMTGWSILTNRGLFERALMSKDPPPP